MDNDIAGQPQALQKSGRPVSFRSEGLCIVKPQSLWHSCCFFFFQTVIEH